MHKPTILLLGSLLSCAQPGIAAASSSQWADAGGGAVRLVITGAPDAGGALRGALQIDLKPGWKTYWQDPGDTGVPPKISVTGAALADVAYPVPRRFDDAGTVWNGYEAPVSFAISLTAPKQGAKDIEAHVFLGICQSICIPLQANLKVAPASDPGNPEDAAIVRQAFEQAPAPARPGFRVTEAKREGSDAFNLQAEFPGAEEKAQLFLAAPRGYSFGPPKQLDVSNGKAIFSVPIYDRPDGATPASSAAYTLVQGTSAVEGTVKLP